MINPTWTSSHMNENKVLRIVRRGELECTVLQTCLGELCTRAAAAQGGAQWFQIKNMPEIERAIFSLIKTL